MVKMAMTKESSASHNIDNNSEGIKDEDHNSSEYEPTEEFQSFVFTELKAVNSVIPKRNRESGTTASGRNRAMQLINIAKL